MWHCNTTGQILVDFLHNFLYFYISFSHLSKRMVNSISKNKKIWPYFMPPVKIQNRWHDKLKIIIRAEFHQPLLSYFFLLFEIFIGQLPVFNKDSRVLRLVNLTPGISLSNSLVKTRSSKPLSWLFLKASFHLANLIKILFY